MALTLSLTLALSSSDHPQQTHQRLPFFLSPPHNKKIPSLFPHKPHRFNFKPSSSSSHSTTTYSQIEDCFKTGRFLSNEEIEKLKTLQDFIFFKELSSGSLCIRVMRPEEMDMTVKLLAESFLESMLLPVGYVSLLRFLVKQYVIERRAALPHAVTLVAFYRGKKVEGNEEVEVDEEVEELAGTVEVCFDKRGANASPPSPTPPKSSPYICNMTVKEQLRRRGIGWNLLKASEELICQMVCKREVYLHCRMIDLAPFNMYTKAGYEIVQTDSIFILLMLQRRKHLMCKKLPLLSNPSEPNILSSDTELSSQVDGQKL